MARMITAVNRQIRALPQQLQAEDARCELARQLARQFDAGHMAVTSQLNRVLGDLARAGRPPPATKGSPVDEAPAVPERTWLDELAGRRRERLAAAADLERGAGGDDRRSGGG
jgi:hypothetical protein